MMWTSGAGTVLSNAARSDSQDNFEASVAAYDAELTSAEVMVESLTYLVLLTLHI